MENNTHPDYLVVRVGLHGLGVFTAKSIKKGETIFTMSGEIISTPSRTSVQIGDGKHIEDNLAGFLNHNCNASAMVNRDKQTLVALRDLKEGDEVTFNYNENETAMAEPFNCFCCNKEVRGSKVKERDKTTAF